MGYRLWLFSLVLLLAQPSFSVENTEGVDWDNPSTTAFVQSTYMAIYGAVPSPEVVKKYASKLKNRGERYRFAKWLLVQPEYQRAHGDPRGEYLICHTIDRTRFTVSKTIPRGYTEAVERGKAFGPAMLLKTYWDPNHVVASKPSKPVVPKPSASGAVTEDGLVGTYTVYKGQKFDTGTKWRKYGTATFGPGRKGTFMRISSNGTTHHTKIDRYEIVKAGRRRGELSIGNAGGFGSFTGRVTGNLQQFELDGEEISPTLGGHIQTWPGTYRLVRQ